MSDHPKTVLDEIEERTRKAAAGPFTVRDVPGGSIEIWASINGPANLQPIYEVQIRPQIVVEGNGKIGMLISYDSYRQFPSDNFEEMQRANADIFAHSITDIPKLIAVARAAAEMKDVFQWLKEIPASHPCYGSGLKLIHALEPLLQPATP